MMMESDMERLSVLMNLYSSLRCRRSELASWEVAWLVCSRDVAPKRPTQAILCARKAPQKLKVLSTISGTWGQLQPSWTT